jgi:hypothetical protein
VKKFLAFALAIAMAISPAFAKKPKSYNVEVEAVGAISIPNPNPANGDGTYAEICSGSLIGYDSDGAGLFLTARHCVVNSGDPEEGTGASFIPNEVVSFNPNLNGPYYQAEPLFVAQNDDIAVLRVINADAVSVGLESDSDFRKLVAGDPVENVSFPLDMGKLEFHGSFVSPTFPHFSRSLLNYPEWKRTMPVDITIGHGSSGSPLFDSRTHKVIGVMVGTTGEGRLMIVEPLSVIEDVISHRAENSPVAFANSHFPKEQFRLPRKDFNAERHPFIPGFGQI